MDNSGLTNRVLWKDENHFEHWSHSYGEWMGPWDNNQYKYIDFDHIDWAVDTIDRILDEWEQHPALYAIEPMNEPWKNSDVAVLKGFYRRVHSHMKKKAQLN